MSQFSTFAQLIAQAFPYLTPTQAVQLATALNGTTVQVSGQNLTYEQIFANTMGESAHVAGASNIYYNASVPINIGTSLQPVYISSSSAAQAYVAASSGQYATIEQTALGQEITALSNQGIFQNAAPTINQFFAQNNINPPVDAYNPTSSLTNAFWRGGSEQFASQGTGNAIYIGPDPAPGSSFILNEAPNISTGLNGLSPAQVTGSSPSELGTLASANQVVDPSLIEFNPGATSASNMFQYGSDITGDVSATDILTSTPNIDPSFVSEAQSIDPSTIAASPEGGEFPGSQVSALGDTVGVVGQLAGSVGEALIIGDIVGSTAQAINQVVTGNNSGATFTMATLAGRVEGGLYGAEVLGTAGAELGAIFGPVGAAAGGIIGGLVGGIVGYELGEQGAAALWKQTATAIQNIKTSWINQGGTDIPANVTANTGGTSQITNIANGSTTTLFFSGANATGSLTKVDQENANGTSQITTYDANGNSITTNFSGSNGTGTQGNQTVTVNNGTNSATVEFGPTELDFPAERLGQTQTDLLSTTVNYVGGNLFNINDVEGLVLVSENYFARYGNVFAPAAFALDELNSTNTQGTITVTANPELFSGANVTADIPITISLGDAATAATSNIVATQAIYSPASPAISIGGTVTNFYDFGTVHVGDTLTVNVAVSNAATAALSDSLLINPTFTSGPFSASGSQDTIQAGSSQTFTVALDTTQAGSFFDGGSIAATSHDSVLADETLNPIGFNFAATVDSYASPEFTEDDGTGTIVQNGSNWSVNLGNIAPIDDTETLIIGVQNANQFLTDSLAGSFDVSGNGFSVSGADPFTDGTNLFVNVDESAVGQNTETIVLHPLSQNSSGFSGTLADQTLTITDTVLCYAADTRITTVRGEVPVEQLAEGDLVLTHHGAAVPVQWIGHRHVNCRRHPKSEKVWPVRVATGAFGDNLPHRDLWLSPDHAVYVDDVLIPIKRLINGMSIAQVPTDQVTYYHVELPQHDLLLAEGMPAESYLDTGDRSRFANGGQAILLHPDFSARIWEAMGCAPLIVTGPRLVATRQRVNARAAVLQDAPIRRVA